MGVRNQQFDNAPGAEQRVAKTGQPAQGMGRRRVGGVAEQGRVGSVLIITYAVAQQP